MLKRVKLWEVPFTHFSTLFLLSHSSDTVTNIECKVSNLFISTFINQNIQILKVKCSCNFRALKYVSIFCGIHFDFVHLALKQQLTGQKQSSDQKWKIWVTQLVTHITEVFLYEGVRRLVNHLVLVVLQQLNTVQTSQLLHQQAQLLRLTQFICRLKSTGRNFNPQITFILT